MAQLGVNAYNYCKCTLILPQYRKSFEYDNDNEIEYMLSQDPKSSNLIIGITSHSLNYHYCYYNSNDWYKGRDRTIRNLRSNQRKWCEA